MPIGILMIAVVHHSFAILTSVNVDSHDTVLAVLPTPLYALPSFAIFLSNLINPIPDAKLSLHVTQPRSKSSPSILVFHVLVSF